MNVNTDKKRLIRKIMIMKKNTFIHLTIWLNLLIINSLQAQFREVPIEVVAVNNSSVSWGDFDNDGDLDMYVMGWDGKKRVTRIYENQAGVFKDIEADLAGANSIACNNLAWGDYNNDGLLDILLTGQNGMERMMKMYRNDGKADFTEVDCGLEGVFAASVAWGDYDNDGDLDILSTGKSDKTDGGIAHIYRNDKGTFVEIKANLEGVEDGSAAWGDYDNDGDWDILLTGRDNSSKLRHSVAKIYRNDQGIFTDVNANLEPVSRSAVTWSDFDNDNDLDILLAGYTDNAQCVSRLYRNDNGKFTLIPSSLIGIQRCVATSGDFDNDFDMDILLSGVTLDGRRIIRVYENKGGFSFVELPFRFAEISSGSAAWGDYNHDGDLDLIITGEDKDFRIYTKLYENTLNKGASTLVATPQNLKADVNGNQVTLSWNKARESGVTYNVRIGTKSDDEDVFGSMSDLKSGIRKLAEDGNTAHHTSWVVKNLAPGTYYWSVQTVNGAYKTSIFAPEMVFVVK
jgi:predicted nucleotidyltransferase